MEVTGLEMASVFVTVGPGLSTFAMPLAFLEMTLVNPTTATDFFTLTLRFAVLDSTYVVFPIREKYLAVTELA